MFKIAAMPVVAAVLVDAEGRALVQRRPAGKPLAGLWEFPGGKIELGETPEAALVRELAEELGIVVNEDALQPLTFVSEPGLLLLFYRCRRWRGVPEARHADELRWASPESLAGLAMPGPNRPVIALLATAPPS